MISDVVAKAVFQLKVDTTDLKKGIREAQAEEQKLLKTQLDAAEKKNAALEGHIKTIGKVTAALGAVGLAASAVWNQYKHEAEKARLSTAALGVDIDKLRKASLGTKSEMQLLADAAKLNNGIFKMTSDEMANVEKAMLAFVRRGHSVEDVQKRIFDAVTELKVNGLDDLGIAFDATGINMDTATGRAEMHRRILLEVTKAAQGLGDASLTMSEQVRKAQADMADGWQDLKGLFLEGAMIGNAQFRIGMEKMKIEAAKKGMDLDEYYELEVALKKAKDEQDRLAQMSRVYAERHRRGQFEDYGIEGAAGIGASSLSGVGGRMSGEYKGNVLSAIGSYSFGGREGGGGSTSLGGANSYGDEFGRDMMGQIDLSNYGRMTSAADEYNAYQQSKLEGIFGPLQDFDAYKTAFETLNGAIGSAFSAWIDGSQSAGAAFKKFIGEALKGVAVQMAMEAVKHGAYAIGNLAFGNFAGAATHAKAAAAFAAGAVLVGASAKALHGGGGSSSPGASAPGGGVPAYSGGASQGGGSQTQVVVFGQDFSNDSARQRQLRAQKVLEDARQAGGNGAISYA